MKLINNVTLELFSRTHDATPLDNWVPIATSTVLQEQWFWHPDREKTRVYELPKQKVSLWVQETPIDESHITIFHYRFSKQSETRKFIEQIKKIDLQKRKKIVDDIDAHMDAKGRLLLRLSVQEPTIVSSGECVFAKINLAAYPKNKETCRKKAKEVLL